MATDQKTYQLAVEPRSVIGKKSRRLHREDLLAGVVYGHNVAPEPVQVSQRELERVYLHAGGNSLIDLKIGSGGSRKVFIHEVQRDPTTHSLRHVDFLVVNLREEIHSAVPLVIVGESPVVHAGDGLLLNALDHVEVRALPLDLPSTIEVDISGLDEIGKALHVSDLTIPRGVTLITHEDELVVKITDLPVVPVIEEVEPAEGDAVEGEADETEGEGESGGASETEDGSA